MQSKNKVQIKGMVCQRCIRFVKTELEAAGLSADQVQLGEVVFDAALTDDQTRQLAERLRPYGFTVLAGRREQLVKEIRDLVARVYAGDYDFPDRFRFSRLVADKTGMSYEAVSAIFTETAQQTLERYIINYRIDKIREWLVYTNETLTDIAYRLGFSSVAHLSRQFKENTGLNPSYYRQQAVLVQPRARTTGAIPVSTPY